MAIVWGKPDHNPEADPKLDPILDYMAWLDRGGDFAERLEDELVEPCPCGSGLSSLLCRCVSSPARPRAGGGDPCTG